MGEHDLVGFLSGADCTDDFIILVEAKNCTFGYQILAFKYIYIFRLQQKTSSEYVARLDIHLCSILASVQADQECRTRIRSYDRGQYNAYRGCGCTISDLYY